MDNLPPISNPALPPLEIEYLRFEGASSALEYDNQGFADFPARAGWDKNALLFGHLTVEFQHNTRPVAEFGKRIGSSGLGIRI